LIKRNKQNRSYFVGIGAYSKASESVLLRDIDLISYSEHKSLIEFCENFKGEYIGVFSGDKGIYIEKALVFPETNVTLETLKSVYTKEECFYQAEIISEDVVWSNDYIALYTYLIEAISNLNRYDGFTLRILNGYIYEIKTVEGELLS